MHALRIFIALSLFDVIDDRSLVQATTIVLLRSETVASAADQVAFGTVVATESRWRDGRIVTRVRLRGADPAADTWFEHPGGTVDGVSMQVVGMPSFRPGEEVVVLLAARGGRLRLIGLSEGKLAVVRRDGRGELYLRLTDDGPLTALPVDDGVTRLRRAAARRHR